MKKQKSLAVSGPNLIENSHYFEKNILPVGVAQKLHTLDLSIKDAFHVM